MKKILRILPLVGLMFIMSLTACNDDSATAPGANKVPDSFTQKLVIEKFTGEWCGACPSASRWMDDMAAKHGDKFIGVGIHAGSSADRYKDNEACKTMYSFLVSHLRHPGLSSISFPNVMFNRNVGPNNQVINGFVGINAYNTKTDEELAKPAKAGLAIESSFDGDNLNVTVKYHLKEALGPDHAVTVYVLENGLDGSKQVSGGAGFMHSHTLRGLLTPRDGEVFDGDNVGNTMTFTADAFDCSEFNKDNLEIVAFINHLGSEYTDRKIINGQSVHAGSNKDFD